MGSCGYGNGNSLRFGQKIPSWLYMVLDIYTCSRAVLSNISDLVSILTWDEFPLAFWRGFPVFLLPRHNGVIWVNSDRIWRLRQWIPPLWWHKTVFWFKCVSAWIGNAHQDERNYISVCQLKMYVNLYNIDLWRSRLSILGFRVSGRPTSLPVLSLRFGPGGGAKAAFHACSREVACQLEG